MSEFIEIHWTCGSLDEARKISRYLVESRLVACVQIIPWIETNYVWNNQLETAQESKVILKTIIDNYDKVRLVIEQNCKYEIPEITFIAFDGGNPLYLQWLKENVLING